LNHGRDLLNELEKVDAVLWIAMHYLLSLDVREVVFQNLLTQQVYKRLNVFSHFVHILTLGELTEVNLRESCLEKLNVEFITIKLSRY
jgi:hypothetical protein